MPPAYWFVHSAIEGAAFSRRLSTHRRGEQLRDERVEADPFPLGGAAQNAVERAGSPDAEKDSWAGTSSGSSSTARRKYALRTSITMTSAASRMKSYATAM